MPWEGSRVGRTSWVLPFAALVLVPLAAAPSFVEPYTSVKWHLLAAFAVLWLLAERLAFGSLGLPGVVTRAWPAWAALAVSVVVGSLRNGLAWAVQPLTARATFVALALASFWWFRRTRLALGPLRAAALAAVSIVVLLGLLQFGGVDLLSWLPDGDHRSATFGNVNMAAEFVGLALVVVLATAPGGSGPGRGRAAGIATEVVAGGALAYLWLAGSRSVGLALVGATGVLFLLQRVTTGRLLRTAGGAALLAGLVGAVAAAAPLVSSLPQSKRASAAWRLAVWSDTLRLVADHPAGVGAGNFETAFIPYALAGRSKPGEAIVFRSPHDEYLRIVSEEGVGGALLLLGLFAVLARALHRAPAVGRWRSAPGALLASCGAYLLVEATFQFPFELACPSLLAAVLLGLALACTEPPAGASSAPAASRRSLPRRGDAATLLLALGIGCGLVRVAWAERLAASRRADVVAQERACALDPRRLDACVQSAWLRSRAGEHEAARHTLRSVLRRSPSYFPAIKLLGEDLLAAGEHAAGCRQLRRYDTMFGGRSSVHRRIREFCPPAP